jgi:dTDP-4-amino-4,6-dideoxygalactose transaminase
MTQAGTRTGTTVSPTGSADPARSADRLLREYEAAFAATAGIRHAIAFSYGRTALSATLSALGLERGHEVVLSPLTCEVVPLALLALDLRPIYADIDPNTLNLSSDAADRAITPAARAVLFQRTYGIADGVREIRALARRHGLRLVEDCAQCLPLKSDTEPAGQEQSVAIYSNNLRKPLPAGAGGIAATNDEALAREIACLRDALPAETLASGLRLRAEAFLHRHLLRPSRYWFLYRLSRRYLAAPRNLPVAEAIAAQIDVAARMPSNFRLRRGLSWSARIEQVAAHSRQCVAHYATSLRDKPELLIPAAANGDVLYFYPVRVRNKPEVLREAEQRRLELIAWPVRTPIFPLEDAAQASSLGYEIGMCPQADRTAEELVGLPTHEQITREHRQAIVALIRDTAA